MICIVDVHIVSFVCADGLYHGLAFSYVSLSEIDSDDALSSSVSSGMICGDVSLSGDIVNADENAYLLYHLSMISS